MSCRQLKRRLFEQAVYLVVCVCQMDNSRLNCCTCPYCSCMWVLFTMHIIVHTFLSCYRYVRDFIYYSHRLLFYYCSRVLLFTARTFIYPHVAAVKWQTHKKF
jgi:hypothetical protein